MGGSTGHRSTCTMSPCCALTCSMKSWNELLFQTACTAVSGDSLTPRLGLRGSAKLEMPTDDVTFRASARTLVWREALMVAATLGATAVRPTPRPAPAAAPNQLNHGKAAASSASMPTAAA